jgi:3-hydroxyisobutyrate dehydrogenase
MGLPMARNIARAGIEVRAWNRSREKAEPLRDDGVSLFDSPAEAADGADVILTILADADAVIGSVERALPSGAIWLQMSTIGEAGIERCEELAEQQGVQLVDAPVLGTKQPAEEGKLVILASGLEALRSRLEPIFDAIGQRTMWVGNAGAATRLKLVVNGWIVTVVEGIGETVAFAEGIGIDPKLFLDAVSGGALDMPYLQMKGKAILELDFTPSFKLRLAAKDAALLQQSADRRGLDLPMLKAISRRLDEGAQEHGDKDMCATYLTSSPSTAAA